MTETRWYCCSKCNKVSSYEVYDDGETSFPRGEFMGHLDSIVTEIETETEAHEYLVWLKTDASERGLSPRLKRLEEGI